jgi:hypothetical protein
MRKTYKTPPVVAGGIYKREIVNEDTGELLETLHGIMGTTYQREGQPVEGMFSVYGFADQRVREGEEALTGWSLVAQPEGLETPIHGESNRSERAEMAATIRELKAQVEALAAAS